MTSCRKAIYVEIEKNYDISDFNSDDPPKGLLGAFSEAPYYTRNKKYIEENVTCPTDFIVLDHSHLDQKLLKLSVNNTSFWNIWRLTPEVYKKRDGGWIVKHEFDILDKRNLIENIEYIFNTTVDIIYSIHTTKQKTKTKEYLFFIANLNSDEIDVYEKADKTSKIIGKTPKGLFEVDCVYHIEGLKGDGPYWKIRHMGKEKYLFGYISNDYIK